MVTVESRFEPDPSRLVGAAGGLPAGWRVDVPDAADPDDVTRLAALVRAHERAGRGWATSGEDDVLVELGEPGRRTRANVVVRDADDRVQAWGSAHDRAAGRMLLVHVVARDLPDDVAERCSAVLVDWAVGQARVVGAARGLEVQQVDTGAFVGDERQQRWLAGAGFALVRRWEQMSRPVAADDAALVPDPTQWDGRDVSFRLVRRAGDGLPDEGDLREVHDVLEGAFADHFNSFRESFDEFLQRLREDPGHRWDHWWLAELTDRPEPQPVGALVGTALGGDDVDPPDGSYVAYLGVLEAARGRGVAKGLLHTIIADAASRGRSRVGLEVDADSPTGAAGLYRGLGWETTYVTQSWHRDVRVG